MDTNQAFVLATEWLSSLSIDTDHLNKSLEHGVKVIEYIEYRQSPTAVPKAQFRVTWSSLKTNSPFEPNLTVTMSGTTKELIFLSIRDTSFWSRAQMIIPNAEAINNSGPKSGPSAAEIFGNAPGGRRIPLEHGANTKSLTAVAPQSEPFDVKSDTSNSGSNDILVWKPPAFEKPEDRLKRFLGGTSLLEVVKQPTKATLYRLSVDNPELFYEDVATYPKLGRGRRLPKSEAEMFSAFFLTPETYEFESNPFASHFTHRVEFGRGTNSVDFLVSTNDRYVKLYRNGLRLSPKELIPDAWEKLKRLLSAPKKNVGMDWR